MKNTTLLIISFFIIWFPEEIGPQFILSINQCLSQPSLVSNRTHILWYNVATYSYRPIHCVFINAFIYNTLLYTKLNFHLCKYSAPKCMLTYIQIYTYRQRAEIVPKFISTTADIHKKLNFMRWKMHLVVYLLKKYCDHVT